MDYCSLEISWALGSKNQLNDALVLWVAPRRTQMLISKVPSPSGSHSLGTLGGTPDRDP